MLYGSGWTDLSPPRSMGSGALSLPKSDRIVRNPVAYRQLAKSPLSAPQSGKPPIRFGDYESAALTS